MFTQEICRIRGANPAQETNQNAGVLFVSYKNKQQESGHVLPALTENDYSKPYLPKQG